MVTVSTNHVGLISLDGHLRAGELIRRVHDRRVYGSGVTVGSGLYICKTYM